MPDRLTPADWLAALVVVLLWGVNFAGVKIALHDFPPFLLVTLRFAGVALLLVPFFRPRRDQLPGILVLAAVLGAGHFGLMFYGLSGVDAATAAIAINLGVPFSSLLAWGVFGERLGWERGAGIALAFVGVGLLAGEPHLPRLLPLLAVVGAALAWAVSNVVVKRIGTIGVLALNGWTMLFAFPMVLGLSLLTESGQWRSVTHAGWIGWSAVAYTVVGSTIVAYSLWYRLLSRHPMNRVVPFTLLGPVIGLAAGVVVLGEPLTWQKMVGGSLTVVGVAVVQLRQRKAS